MIAEQQHQHRWQPVGLHGDTLVYAILSCECGAVIRTEPTNVPKRYRKMVFGDAAEDE